MPCNATPFILANLTPNAQMWEQETRTIQKLKDVGVWVSPGRSHHMPEHTKGWARITFALDAKKMERALGRMKDVFRTASLHK